MTLNWMDYEDSPEEREKFIAWFICEAAGEHMGKISKDDDFDSTKLDVELKINGTTVEFVEVVRFMWDQFHQQVEEASHKNFEEIKNRLIDAMEEVEE